MTTVRTTTSTARLQPWYVCEAHLYAALQACSASCLGGPAGRPIYDMCT